MGKFKPKKLGATIFVISAVVVTILGLSTLDTGLALQFQPPELRVVGGCFRDCIDPEQTGFGEQDPVTQLEEEGSATIILTDPDDPNNTTETTILIDEGIMVIEDPETGEQTIVVAGTDDPFESCDQGLVLFEGECWIQTIQISESEYESLLISDTVACWLNVHANVHGINGVLIDTEQSSFFMTEPVPQLSLADLPTGISLDDELSGYRLFPMMKCATNTVEGGIVTSDAFPDSALEQLYIFPSFTTPLKLEMTQLVARVYSQTPDGKLIDTFNFPFDIPAQDITDATSRNLGEIFIPADRLFVFLPDGNYNSIQHIVIEGKLVLHWDTGLETVDNVPQVIRLQTIQTRDEDGNVLSIVNPVTIFRDLQVEKNVGEGGSNGGEERPECQSGEFVLNGICTPVDRGGCGENFILLNGVCEPVNPSGGGDPSVGTQNFLDRFLTCVQSGSTDCLLSSEFIPMYLIGVGGIVLIGGLTARARQQPDIYGVPRGF